MNVCSICKKSHNGKWKTCEHCLGTKRRFREKHPNADREWYMAHREQTKEYYKKYNYERRLKILTHYSKQPLPVCDCCGEGQMEFLTIDHINGGGTQHRKKMTGEGHTTDSWIIKNDFPDGFRVLCWNCNWAAYKYGICPHQKL